MEKGVRIGGSIAGQRGAGSFCRSSKTACAQCEGFEVYRFFDWRGECQLGCLRGRRSATRSRPQCGDVTPVCVRVGGRADVRFYYAREGAG